MIALACADAQTASSSTTADFAMLCANVAIKPKKMAGIDPPKGLSSTHAKPACPSPSSQTSPPCIVESNQFFSQVMISM